MVKLLNWNIRGLGTSVKRRFLSDILKDNSIDIVGIQETKKEQFKSRTLHALSFYINQWIVKPSVGASGGILLGYNDSLLSLISSVIGSFSITAHFRNKQDNFE